MEHSHKGEADPLHSQLGNAEQSGKTVERLQLLAAGYIIARLLEEQDVGEARRGGCGAQEDEVGRDAFGGAPGDNSDHLRQIADQEADDYKTAHRLSAQVSSVAALLGEKNKGLALTPPG